MEFTVKMMCPSLHLREQITHVAAHLTAQVDQPTNDATHQELVFLYHRASSAANTRCNFLSLQT